MKIVIIGYGKVGRELVDVLYNEGNDITVIDNNPELVERAINDYDVLGITGNGASIEILKSAQVDTADSVIAATSSDEINILTCLMAKQLNVKHLIARCRNYEYVSQIDWMKKEIGINLFINPELEAAEEIKNIINFPEAISVERLASGKVDLVEFFIPESSPLCNKSLFEIHRTYKTNVLICAVVRGEMVFIPKGDFVLKAGDHIHITAERSEIRTLLTKLNFIENRIKNVLIIGGGKISYYLIDKLLDLGLSVKVIEQNKDRCMDLAETFPHAAIINGDGTSEELLTSEGISSADALICLTGLDEENMIIAMYAEKLDIPKIITKVNKTNFKSLIESIGFASVISPKTVATSRIVKYLRTSMAVESNNIQNLFKFASNELEAIEFIATENSKLLNKQIKDLKVKADIIISTIIRDDEVIIPSGADEIRLNDRIIIITKNIIIDELDAILE